MAFILAMPQSMAFWASAAAGDTAADFVAEFGQVLKGVRIHRAFAGDFDEGGLGAILFGARGFAGTSLAREGAARRDEHQIRPNPPLEYSFTIFSSFQMGIAD